MMYTNRMDGLTRGIAVAVLGIAAGCASSQTNARMEDLKSKLSEAQSKRQALEERIAELEKKNEELRAQLDETGQASKQFCKLVTQLQQMIEAGKLDVRVERNRMIVELPEKILFPSGQAALKKKGRDALSKVADVLKKLENRVFLVAGHTDNLPIDNEEFSSNWELSSQRAINVTQFLIKEGMGPKRLGATGYADTRPVSSNDTEEGRAKNRRTEIVLEPNLEELPDLSELEGSC